MGWEAGWCKTSTPYGVFIVAPSLEGWSTKVKKVPSPHQVRLGPLDTNPVLQCLGCYFQRCGYFWGVIWYDRWVLSEGHKNHFKDWHLMNSQPTFLFLTYLNLIMVILSKGCKPDNFELHNSLELSFKNIQAFVRILLIANLSLNQTLLTFLLCGRQTWMTQLVLTVSLWEVIFL